MKAIWNHREHILFETIQGGGGGIKASSHQVNTILQGFTASLLMYHLATHGRLLTCHLETSAQGSVSLSVHSDI